MANNQSLMTWDALARVGARMRKYLGGQGRHGGLHGPQYHALIIITESGDAGIRMSDLGSRLFVTGSNVTGLVDRLEEKGFAVRETDPADRRVLLARATPAGRALYEAVAPREGQMIARVLGCLTEGEMATLAALLNRVAESVQAALDDPAAPSGSAADDTECDDPPTPQEDDK